METHFYRHQLTFPSALRRVARQLGWRATAWRYIARRLACEFGSVRVWLADDTVMIFEREADKVTVRSIKPGAWAFHATPQWDARLG
jgi:hypothetical protein